MTMKHYIPRSKQHSSGIFALRRLGAALLAALLLLSLAACGGAPRGAGPQESAPVGTVELPVASDPPESSPPEGAPPESIPPESAPPESIPPESAPPESTPSESPQEDALPEDGSYTSKEDVALFIHLYGRLPDNFITKREAEDLGWSGGSLEPYAPGKCIGGSRFGNYEGLLPSAAGRTYAECDIDTLGARSRGAKRIVFSNDGLIYYTEDHYASFELLYGEE